MTNVTPLRRTAITVRDLEASLRFYQQALGLRIWKRGEAGPDNRAFARLMGAPPCTVRWAVLQSGDVEWGMVGLFELSGPPPPAVRRPQPARNHRGEACLVFHAPDVRRIHRLARRLGASVLCPPTRLRLPQQGLETLEMTLRDPDGVLLNFIQGIRGGLAPHNRYPGDPARPAPVRRRRVASPARQAEGRGSKVTRLSTRPRKPRRKAP